MRYWCAIVLAVGCVASQHAAAQDKDKEAPLTQIFADWKHRQGLFKTARWVIAGTTEEMNPGSTPASLVHPRHTLLLLDFVGKRYRLETADAYFGKDEQRRSLITPRESILTFDGAIARISFNRKLGRLYHDWPDLEITDDSEPPVAGSEFEAYLWPVLYAHGLTPTGNTHIRITKLPPKYAAEQFEVGKPQKIGNQQFTVVKTERAAGAGAAGGEEGGNYDELWINRSQKSAVHRYVNFNGRKPWHRLDVEWVQTESGWRPEKWTYTEFSDEKVRRIYRLRVDSFKANPPVADGDFTLEAKPGMKVKVTKSPPPGKGLHKFFPASKTYRVLPSGDWRLVAAEGFTTEAGKKLPPEVSPEPDRAWIRWIVAGVVLVGGVVVYRFRRKRAA